MLAWQNHQVMLPLFQLSILPPRTRLSEELWFSCLNQLSIFNAQYPHLKVLYPELPIIYIIIITSLYHDIYHYHIVSLYICAFMCSCLCFETGSHYWVHTGFDLTSSPGCSPTLSLLKAGITDVHHPVQVYHIFTCIN